MSSNKYAHFLVSEHKREMYPSAPNDGRSPRFPAIIRRKTTKKRTTMKASSSRSLSADKLPGSNSETDGGNKYEQSNDSPYFQIPCTKVESNAQYRVDQFILSNNSDRMHSHSTPRLPLLTPIRPRSRHDGSVLSPPGRRHMVHDYQHDPTNYYPAPSGYAHIQKQPRINVPAMVGNPALKIFRLHLPPHLMHLLDSIVLGCEAYAATRTNGWLTDLYSLTKQDVALREIPHAFDMARPIVTYITRCMRELWGVECLLMDKNQPHILKYDDGHTGVELHHDKCDITANLCLSRTTSYVGGG